MEFTDLFLFLFIILLILISGIMSGSETALTALSRAKIHKLKYKETNEN